MPIEDVVGADLVRGWGGRVLQIDLLIRCQPRAACSCGAAGADLNAA